ncbi:MAG: PAS domain S-box protein [Blastochloris viridis]|uniref:Blue-light-activated histidine kinase n=1 Tax=Blastochloris viridis TaxID=1079 RepID=A0A6N4R701_BLAVI|nr:MAG: PAS domain S-box protein [Blastochloris viridis]
MSFDTLLTAFDVAMTKVRVWLFASSGYIPRGDTMHWDNTVLRWDIGANAINSLACLMIAIGFFVFASRRRDFNRMFLLLAYLIGCLFIVRSAQNAWSILVLWEPLYGAQTLIKVLSASLTALTACILWSVRKDLLNMPGPGHLHYMEGRLHDLSSRIHARQDTVESLVEERTQELQGVRMRFEQAIAGAGISVFTQDRNLRYTWVFSADDLLRGDVLGKTDFDVLPPNSCGPVVALKQRAIASGKSHEAEVSIRSHGQETWYRMHIDPVLDSEGRVTSLNGIAVNISDRKMLEDEQVRLSSELAANLHYYKLAMESSHTVVFTMDENLRYATVSHDFIGRPPEFYIGKTNAESLPPETYAALKPLKTKALESGNMMRGEIKAVIDGQTRWYDLSIAPLKNRAGVIVGLTGAVIDISERKGWEQHLRLLMRELTHRSKNLLAVIQAMARQTARHSGTVEEFIDRFGARLHALAGSHDLLVQESWQRASIGELITSQLGHYSDLIGTQIVVDGPQIYLNPDAAQNLGMALHEMATNAVKYGALSTPKGKVSIDWAWKGSGAKRVLRLSWKETGGPAVQAPQRRGFGSQVIERNLNRALGATVKLDYAAKGFRADMELPPNVAVDK